MSVIVKNMKMPKNCWECSLSDIDDDFGRCCLYSGIACLAIGRQDNCPLVEIPTPHGRLVDIKSVEDRKFTTVGNEYERWWNGALDSVVDNAPTVIEAEGSET